MVDVTNTNGEVKVMALLPSVDRRDVRINGTEDTLTISVDTPQHRYYKKVDLPAKVNPEKVETSYKNSVLEVVLQKRKEQVEHRKIPPPE